MNKDRQEIEYQVKENRRRRITAIHNKKFEKSDEKDQENTPEIDQTEPVKEYNNKGRNRFENKGVLERNENNSKSRGKFAGIPKRGPPSEATMKKYPHEMTNSEVEKNKLEQTLLRAQMQRDNVLFNFFTFLV